MAARLFWSIFLQIFNFRRYVAIMWHYLIYSFENTNVKNIILYDIPDYIDYEDIRHMIIEDTLL